jgi:hypothetical protein
MEKVISILVCKAQHEICFDNTHKLTKTIGPLKNKFLTKVVADNAAFLFRLLARVVLHMGYAVVMLFVSYYLQIRCENHQFFY